MQRICERCGEPFGVEPREAERGRGRYCSRECRYVLNPIRVEGDTAYVTLTDRHGNPMAVAKIDAEDVPNLETFGRRWAASEWNGDSLRVVARIALAGGKSKTVSMHRWLMDAPDGVEVDHKNGDTLDNRRSRNLRLVTSGQNKQNRRGARKDSLTGVRNVTWDKVQSRYVVRVGADGKKHLIGYYKTLAQAEQAAVEARARLQTHSPD